MAANSLYELGKATDRGRKRAENEDRLDVFEPQDRGQLAQKGSLYIVADGMGGHEAGAVASDRIVRKIIDEYYYGAPNLGVREGLEHAIHVANVETFRLATQKPDWSGMGATVVAAIVRGDEVQVANVGDSRALLFRPGDKPRQLSVDHTYVGELMREGKMTPEEALHSPRRHQITRALGRRPDVAVELAPPERFLPGDALVLCSDGLSDMLSNKEMEAVVVQFPAQEAANKLVAQANARGGVDNISVIVLKRPGVPPPPVGMPAQAQKKPTPVRWILALLGLVAVSILLFATAKFFLPGAGKKTPTPVSVSPTISVVPGVAETLFPTPTPTRAAAGPTSTLLPTETPKPATATPTSTRTPTPTLTPKGPIYPAPMLLEPADGTSISGQTIHLRWSWSGTLKTGEWFDLWVWPRGEVERPNQLLRSADVSVYPPGGVGVYYWKVRLVKGEPGKPEAVPLSDWSEVRSFDYQGVSAPPPTARPPRNTPLLPTLTPVLPKPTPVITPPGM